MACCGVIQLFSSSVSHAMRRLIRLIDQFVAPSFQYLSAETPAAGHGTSFSIPQLKTSRRAMVR